MPQRLPRLWKDNAGTGFMTPSKMDTAHASSGGKFNSQRFEKKRPYQGKKKKASLSTREKISEERGLLMIKGLALFLCSLFSFASVSFAYDVMEVKNGGGIAGTVASATARNDEKLTISSDVKYCGNSLPAEKYLISPDKKIKNVVVFIASMKGGKAVPKVDTVVSNMKCAFVPHVSVGFAGNNFTTKNDDPMFHNIHTYIDGKTVYNIGLPNQGASVSKPLRKTGVMEITCDAHPWMHAYVYIFDHPYAAVSNDKGEFDIKDIPPGVYNIEAWHEALGTVKMGNVKVEAGKASQIKLEYK